MSQGVAKKENVSQTQARDGQWLVKSKGKTIIDINQEDPSEEIIPIVEETKGADQYVDLQGHQAAVANQNSSSVQLISSAVSSVNQFMLLADDLCDKEVEEVIPPREGFVIHAVNKVGLHMCLII